MQPDHVADGESARSAGEAPVQVSATSHTPPETRQVVEAEAKLIASDVPAALTLINGRRTSLSLAPVTASTLAEGWAALKRERGIELWLESRRLGDLRRWEALSRPGALDPKEELPGRNLCFATPLSEKQTNTNFPR